MNFNPLTTYQNAGRIAARAAHRNDAALATSTHQWLNHAVRLEEPSYGFQAWEAFNQAYRDESDNSGSKTFFL